MAKWACKASDEQRSVSRSVIGNTFTWIIYFRSRTPETPLVLEHETRQYVLKEDTFFQSTVSPIEPQGHLVSTTRERRLDHQSSEPYISYEVSYILEFVAFRSESPQVHCSDLSSDAAWKIFWDRCENVVQDKLVSGHIQSWQVSLSSITNCLPARFGSANQRISIQ